MRRLGSGYCDELPLGIDLVEDTEGSVMIECSMCEPESLACSWILLYANVCLRLDFGLIKVEYASY